MKALLAYFLKTVAGFCKRHKIVLLVVLALVIGYRLGGIGKSPSQVAQAPIAGQAKTAEVWTCSMHPQIRLPKPGLCPICHMELIPLSVTQAGGLRELAVSEEAAALMDIEVAPVERRFVAADVRMVGKIDYDETNLSYITAWVPGRLDRLFVDYTGVTVKEGDHMVSLYSPELISAQEELLQGLQAVRNIQGSDQAVMRRLTEETATAARDKLRLLGLTEAQIAEIESTGQVQDHVTIYAPTGGIVINKDALEGMYVETGMRIYTIADLSGVWARLDAYESDLGWLRYGQRVEFTSVSYPGEIFTGAISFIDPVLSEMTRTVKVRVNVPNSDGRLKPGMFVKAVVKSELAAGGRVMDADMIGKWICPMHPDVVKEEPGRCDICEMPLVTAESLGYAGAAPQPAAPPLVIPASAALVTGTRAIVYVKRPDTEIPTFEGREILLGPRAGDYYLVRTGLEEGELVVVKGNFKIDSSLQISGKPSMMTPDTISGPVHEHGAGMPHKAGAAPPAAALPPLTAHQIRNVIAAAGDVGRTLEGQDLTEIRDAFGRVAEAIDAVDMTLMTGDAHLQWMEYRMRLRNDAIEGMEAETLADMERVAGSLQRNIDATANKFGLMEEREEKHEVLVPDVFRAQLGALFDAYAAMQTALAGDDAAGARTAAEQIPIRLEEIDATVLPVEVQEDWTKASQDMTKSLSDLATDDDLAELRKDFDLLSRPMIEAAERFGPAGDKPLYVIHCPMAFENRGASWLQADTDIRNPYFGAAMLKCGNIEKLIGPRKKRNGEN